MVPFRIILVLVFAASIARSDDLTSTKTETDDLLFGFIGGATFASASVNAVEGAGRNSILGTLLGGFGDVPITQSLSFRVELDYVTKGSYDLSGGLTQLSYLDLPLLAEIHLIKRTNVELLLPFGISPGVLVQRSERTSGGAYYAIATSAIAQDELSLVAGIGASFKLSSEYRLFTILRYDYGLTNVAQFQVGGQSPAYYNRNLSLLIGIGLSEKDNDPDSYESMDF